MIVLYTSYIYIKFEAVIVLGINIIKTRQEYSNNKQHLFYTKIDCKINASKYLLSIYLLTM